MFTKTVVIFVSHVNHICFLQENPCMFLLFVKDKKVESHIKNVACDGLFS